MAKTLKFDTESAAVNHLRKIGSSGPETDVRLALISNDGPVAVYTGGNLPERLGELGRNDWGGLTFTPE